MSGAMRSIGGMLLLAALLYLALLVYLWFNQAGMLYLPHYGGRAGDVTPLDAGLRYEDVTLLSEDGVQLHAWWLPHQQPRAVILFCHGNAGTIADRLSTLKWLHGLGFATLIFDYRGYGRSTGQPSEAGTYLDAEAAWQYLRAQGHDADEIVIMGRSLGAAVAAQLAARHTPAALVLESTFTSIPDLAAELYPLFPARALVRFRYDTLDRISAIEAPLLIVHSRDDEIIPFAHGKRLFAAARAPKQFLELQGGHNDGIYVSGVDVYLRGLDAFFKTYVDER